MIRIKDVVTIKVPFPDIHSELASTSHMYICLQEGINKTMVKCQREKPKHLLPDRPPYNYVQEKADSSRNPFKSNTLIDCDKKFRLNKVEIDETLLTTIRRNVCDDIYNQIDQKISRFGILDIEVNTDEILSANPKIRLFA